MLTWSTLRVKAFCHLPSRCRCMPSRDLASGCTIINSTWAMLTKSLLNDFLNAIRMSCIAMNLLFCEDFSRFPQYNRENLERRLENAGIGYEHMKALGGLRHPRNDSPNMGWRNESFRGYADQNPETGTGVHEREGASMGPRSIDQGNAKPIPVSPSSYVASMRP